MSLFKSTFEDYVSKQLKLRETILNQDLRDLSPGNNLPAGAFYSYTRKTCTIRMCSGVDLTSDNLIIDPTDPFERDIAVGSGLAARYILEGGTLGDASIGNSNFEDAPPGFLSEGSTILVRDPNDPNKLIPSRTLGEVEANANAASAKLRFGVGRGNGAYGDPYLRSNAGDGFGIVPMPGITSLNVRTATPHGGLREAKVEFKCHNRRQLEVLETLYMRPGYPILLEWGWNPYITNEGTIEQQFRRMEEFFNMGSDLERLQKIIRERKAESDGNYDGFIGTCKNYQFAARADGGYDCSTELMAMGEVLADLKSTKSNTVNFSAKEKNQALKELRSNPDGYENIDLSDDLINFLITLRSQPYISAATVDGTSEEDQEQQQQTIQTAIQNVPTQEDTYMGGNSQTASSILAGNTAESATFDASGRSNDEDSSTAAPPGRYSLIADYGNIKNKHNYSLLVKLQNKLRYIGVDEKKQPTVLDKDLAFAYSLYDNTSENGKDKGKNPTPERFKYIRFDFLCEMINKYVIPNYKKSVDNTYEKAKTPLTPNGKHEINSITKVTYLDDKDLNHLEYSIPILAKNLFEDFKTDNITEYINAQGFMGISYDPNICIMPHQNYNTIEGDKLIKNLTNSVKPEKNNYLGHVLLNLDMLSDVYYETKFEKISAKEKGDKDIIRIRKDFSLKKFFDKVWDNVNDACGGFYDFAAITEHERTHVLRIVDLTYQSDLKSENLTELNIEGKSTTARGFSFHSKIDDDMASIISVAAQAPDSLNSLESLSFKKFNIGTENRFSEKLQIDRSSARKQLISDLDTLKSKLKKLKKFLITLEDGVYNPNKHGVTKVEDISHEQASTIANGLEEDVISINGRYPLQADDGSDHPDAGLVRQESSYQRSAIIPLLFQANLEGLSGIIIGNVFKINKNHLPLGYTRDDIGFIVTGESQDIKDNNDWTTTITGQMILLDEVEAEGKNPVPKDPPASNELDDIDDDELLLNPTEDQNYPVEIASSYPYRNNGVALHLGLDIAIPQGTPLVAVHDGNVEKRLNGGTGEGGYGQYIILTLDKPDKLTGTEKVLYAHLSEVLKEGPVKRGDLIAKSGGQPGTYGAGTSEGPHLHYETAKLGAYSGNYFSLSRPKRLESGLILNPMDTIHYSGGIGNKKELMPKEGEDTEDS